MNDMHDYPDEYKGSGVLVEAALPDGRRVPADVMHLVPSDQVRYLLWQNAPKIKPAEPAPYLIDLQFCHLYDGIDSGSAP
jgi:hypothetical protein